MGGNRGILGFDGWPGFFGGWDGGWWGKRGHEDKKIAVITAVRAVVVKGDGWDGWW